MRTQTELNQLFATEMINYWNNKRMSDYCIGKCAYIVELADGDYMEIEKPDIKKDFCFGYGYCGVSTDEDYNDAAASAANARTNVDYFMEKNLQQIDGYIEELTESQYNVYKRVRYSGAAPDCKLKDLTFVGYWQEPPTGAQKLTEQEIAAIIAGYEEVKKTFIRRLNSYLKRYGLTKVNSWTYLSD